MDDQDRSLADLGEKWQGVGNKIKGVGQTLSSVTGSIADFAARAIQGAQELKGELTGLETNAKMAGQSMDAVNDAMVKMQAVTGETGSSFKGLSSILSNGVKGEKLIELADSLAGASVKFKETWNQSLVELGKVLEPILTLIVENITKLINKFNEMSPEGQTVIVAIAGIAIAVGQLLIVVGSVITSVGTIMGILSELGAVFAFITGPIGIAIAAITALGVAAYLIYENWDSIKEYFVNLWEGIKEATSTAASAVVEFLKEWGPLILAAIAGPIGLLVYSIVQNWEAIKEKTAEIWDGIKNFVVDAFKGLYDHNYYFKDIVDTISKAWEDLKAVTEQAWNNIGAWLGSIWQGISGTASSVWSGIKNTLTSITSDISSIIQGAWTSVTSVTSSAWNSVSSIISGISSSIKNTLSNLVGQGYQWGKNLLDEFGKGISDRIDYLKNMAKQAVDQIARVLGFHSPAKEGPGKDADKWAPNFMNMFADGILAGIPNIKAAVTDAVSAMGGLQIAPVAALPAVAVATQATSGSNNFQFTFSGPISVRSDNDIKRVAQELYYLQQGALRGQGR